MHIFTVTYVKLYKLIDFFFLRIFLANTWAYTKLSHFTLFMIEHSTFMYVMFWLLSNENRIFTMETWFEPSTGVSALLHV